jgi:hypothetical protein
MDRRRINCPTTSCNARMRRCPRAAWDHPRCLNALTRPVRDVHDRRSTPVTDEHHAPDGLIFSPHERHHHLDAGECYPERKLAARMTEPARKRSTGSRSTGRPRVTRPGPVGVPVVSEASHRSRRSGFAQAQRTLLVRRPRPPDLRHTAPASVPNRRLTHATRQWDLAAALPETPGVTTSRSLSHRVKTHAPWR